MKVFLVSQMLVCCYSIQMPAFRYWTNAGWVVVLQSAGHGVVEMSGLSQLSQQWKHRMTHSALLRFADGVALQNLISGPAHGSSSNHPAPFPVQEQESAVTSAHTGLSAVSLAHNILWLCT